MARGDHIFVWRHHKGVPFQHHAIDLGDSTVIHFTDGSGGPDGGIAGPGGNAADFEVQLTSIDVITRQGLDKIHVVSHQNAMPPESVVERAVSQLGRKGYHLLSNNCEHFACWCVVDRDESRQVSVAYERLCAVGIKAVASGVVRATTSLGVKRVVRGASPWMLVADAAQWATEVGGHHVGLRDPQRRKHVGRAVGMTTALGIGACGGPAGVLIAGGIWIAGEIAGEATQAAPFKSPQASQQD